MGSAVLSVVFGTPPAKTGSGYENYRDSFATTAVPLIMLLIILILGVYLPDPVRHICADAAALLEVRP
jgi:hydrogenase-4 component F